MLKRRLQALVRSLRSSGREAVTSRPAGARTVAYAPDLDGRADPGEIVWTLVAYEDDPSTAKDRPVLIVGRKDARTVQALMLSSQAHRADDQNWMPLGRGTWDSRGRPSFVRLDRVLELGEGTIRREGAVLDAARFGQVAHVLQTQYGWR
jgi:hypothetical protein